VAFLRLAVPDRFQVVRLIGEGGMGVVYEAVDVERGERIALKTILHHDPDTVARVKREFRALQDIHHPNLVGLRELVAETDDVFFTMELVEGVDLLTWVRGQARRAPPSASPTAVDLRERSDEADTETLVDLDARHEPPRSGAKPRSAPRAASFDEARLRDALRQIALGLSALHAAGKVHRDVKPSNVRVTPEGRVVLLDFGLVLEVDARLMTEGNVVGTPAYMAPEQASSVPVGPEADWYSVGVVLYECLTGRRPYEGDASHVLLAKRYQDPLPPNAYVIRVPQDLEELCLELLQAEPRARPAGDDVLRRLRARASDRPTTGGAPFIGREGELAALTRAFDDIGAGKTVTVALHGESGVGKSCLARRFMDVVLAGRGDVLVLAGRCYEREAVPYKALDEVMEALSRRLASLPRGEALPLMPPDMDSLASIFPGLGRLGVRISRPSFPGSDPLDRRRAAFRALRELLVRLARGRRVVVAIDDLQWTDADSLALLQEVLRPPSAPPLLLILTTRDAPNDAGRPPLFVASLPGDVRAVRVGRLAAGDARRLAQELLAHSASGPAGNAEAIAAEAEGHPLFIDELVRHSALAPRGPQDALRLDDALWRRVLRLDETARHVLEVACVLGAPAAQETVAHAAGIDMGELARAVSLLRASNLVRTGGARATDTVEPFHDRVREALVARIEPGARKDCHHRIAAALELSRGSDPEVLATHWAEAGEPARAARHALVAADQAAHALAFHRAARLCERALVLLPEADPRRRAVREQLGDALANAGECARAAEAYETAAEGAGAAEAIDLRRRAADQLLRAGQVDRGMATARGVLTAVGVGLPRSAIGTLLALLWYRLVLWLRGTRVVERSGPIDPADRTRIDVLWSVAFTLPYADPIAAGVCHARHVLLGLRAGDPMRAARALAMEACLVSSTHFRAWPRVESLLAAARVHAERCGTPYARAIYRGLDGIASCAAMRFEDAVTKLEEAEAMFRAHCPGSAYEIATSQFYRFASLAYSTRYGRLRPLLEGALSDARERGDRHAAVLLRIGILNSTWLFAGDPARARREIEEARSGWVAAQFRAAHYNAVVAEGWVDLYEGEYERGYARLHEQLPDLRRSMLLRLQTYRAELAAIRGRLAFARATKEQGRRREAFVREGEKTIPALAVMPGPLGRVNVRVMRANAARLRGRVEASLAIVDEMAGDDAGDAWLSRQCARLLLARIRDDAELGRLAETELTASGGVADPRMTRLYFPAFDEPSAASTRG
jgi:serine/threonine protein kinase